MGKTFINQALCDGCGACLNFCRSKAIYFNKLDKFSIDETKCTDCKLCIDECSLGAIVEPKAPAVFDVSTIFQGVKYITITNYGKQYSFMTNEAEILPNGYVDHITRVVVTYYTIDSPDLGILIDYNGDSVPDSEFRVSQITYKEAVALKIMLEKNDLVWDANTKKIVFRVTNRVPAGTKYFYFDSDFSIKEAIDSGAYVGMDANRFKVQNYFKKRERAEIIIKQMMSNLKNTYPENIYWF